MSGFMSGLAKIADGMSPVLKGWDRFFGDNLADWARDRVASSAAGESLERLRSDHRGLLAKAHNLEFSKEVLRDAWEPFHLMSHREIWDAVGRMYPDDISWGIKQLDCIGKDSEHEAERFKRALDSIFDNDWEGAAAVRAKAAIDKYVKSELNMRSAIEMICNRLNIACQGVSLTKTLMSPPGDGGHYTLKTALARSIYCGEAVAAKERAELQYDARMILHSVYAPYFMEADKGVPIPPRAHEVTAASQQGPATVPAASFRPPTDQPVPAMQVPPGLAKPPSAPVIPSSNVAPTQPSLHPLGDMASALKPSLPGLPGSAGSKPDLPSPGGLPQLPSEVRPAGVNPLDPQHKPGSVASLPPGSPGGRAGAEAAGSSPGQGAAGRGMAGMPGMPMMPGGRGNGGQKDRERKTPDYLVNAQNGKDLIGKLPKVAPPVLGA